MRACVTHNEMLDEMAQRLLSALEKYAIWHRGRLFLPYEAVAEAVLPEELADPPQPDTATTMPGGTPERLQQLIERAEANRSLFPPAERDLEALGRLAAMLKPAKGAVDGRSRRIGRRKHYQVVVETHSGAKPLRR